LIRSEAKCGGFCLFNGTFLLAGAMKGRKQQDKSNPTGEMDRSTDPSTNMDTRAADGVPLLKGMCVTYVLSTGICM
jgi:hypothetical protein